MNELYLFLLMVVPLAAAGVVVLAPERLARTVSMWGMVLAGVIALRALMTFDWSYSTSFQFGSSVAWLPRLGLSLSVGADSVSMVLVALTALLGPLCVACSYTAITERVKAYYAWLLVLQAAMFGVFVARDLVLFYIAFEFTLVPMYVLIALWGSTNRRRAATKFFLYTFTGSMIALAGLVYVAWHNATLDAALLPRVIASQYPAMGSWTFDIATLQQAALLLSPAAQGWVLAALLAGFAVKVPLFPLHTWLPLAHTEAPTAGSVILAGVLLKLGTYGIYRFAIPFAPVAFGAYAPTIAMVCIVGILYGGLICWVQTDVKKLVAYSSVAHLGFCILGMAALNTAGLSGSILYMINHGLSTGALFLLIGMIYERYHTRNMKELGGLAARMPVWATYMVFFTMASVGLPGLNGFVSEFLCLLGAFQADSRWGTGIWQSGGSAVPGATLGNLGPWYATAAGVGMIVAAMYLLYMVGRVVFGPLVEPGGHGHEAHGSESRGAHGHGPGVLPTDLNRREILTLAPLAVACVVLGVYPGPVLEALNGPVQKTAYLVRDAMKPQLARTPGPAAGEAGAGVMEEAVDPDGTGPREGEVIGQ